MAAMFFDGSKIPTSVLRRIPQGTFIPSFVPIGQVVSEEKSFEDDDGHQVTAIAHMAFGKLITQVTISKSAVNESEDFINSKKELFKAYFVMC